MSISIYEEGCLGYTIELNVKGIGYHRVSKEKGKLIFHLGYRASHSIILEIPKESPRGFHRAPRGGEGCSDGLAKTLYCLQPHDDWPPLSCRQPWKKNYCTLYIIYYWLYGHYDFDDIINGDCYVSVSWLLLSSSSSILFIKWKEACRVAPACCPAFFFFFFFFFFCDRRCAPQRYIKTTVLYCCTSSNPRKATAKKIDRALRLVSCLNALYCY